MTALDQVRTLCRSLSSGLHPHPDVSDAEWAAWLSEPLAIGETRRCPKCGEPLVEIAGRYGPFLGCSAYPDCRYTEAAA